MMVSNMGEKQARNASTRSGEIRAVLRSVVAAARFAGLPPPLHAQ
jgi:hypothetical protein